MFDFQSVIPSNKTIVELTHAGKAGEISWPNDHKQSEKMKTSKDALYKSIHWKFRKADISS